MIVMKDKWFQLTAGLRVSPNFTSVSSGNDWQQGCLNLQIEQIQFELISKADGFNSQQRILKVF